MATKTRKAKELTATFEPSRLVGPLCGLLQLDDGKDAPMYAVCEVKGDAPRCFEVQKLDGSEPYMVGLTYGGQARSCDCLGWLRWSKCRHTEEVGRLVSEGKI
jgi:hypothetical protein